GSQRRSGDAAAGYGTAAAGEPYEPIYWTTRARDLARVALAGQTAAQADALAAEREAVAVDPNSPVGHVALAELATAFGSCDLARSEAAVAATLQSGHDDVVTRAAACR